MAVGILQQPISLSLHAAYRPIYFAVIAAQTPLGDNTQLPPAVYADIYINGDYYKTLFKTQPSELIPSPITVGGYEFDIQDALQEYLRSSIVNPIGAIQQVNGAVAEVFVRFRNAYTDTDGVTQQTGAIPVQSTEFTLPSAGGGEQSVAFNVTNSTIQHENNQDLDLHLQFYSPNYAIGNVLRFTHQPLVKCACINHYDYLNVLTTTLPMVVGTAVTQTLVVVYKDGSTATLNNALTLTSTAYSHYALATGPKQMQLDFPAINWSQVSSYEIIYTGSFSELGRQSYNIECCSDYSASLLFLNYLGAYDGISFCSNLEYYNTKSERWEKPLNYPLDKSDGGYKRYNVRANEKYKAKVKCYTDKDKEWIKELLDSPQSYLMQPELEGQDDAFIPVNILDVSDYQLIKEEETWQYEFEITFEPGNETIRQRN